jgi:hypothetical protein
MRRRHGDEKAEGTGGSDRQRVADEGEAEEKDLARKVTGQ